MSGSASGPALRFGRFGRASSRSSRAVGRLLGAGPPVGRFDEAELRGLPEPVRRYLFASIAPGTPLPSCVRIAMRGRILVGRWLPFVATELLNPHRGFVWAARAAGVVTGSDRYVDGAGDMAWRLGGVVPVARASGPDVSRSAAGRAAAEAVWVPTALLPRFGVAWSADDDSTITARYTIGELPVELVLRLDEAGRPVSVTFDRWGDPDQSGTWGWHRFGGELEAYQRYFGTVVPSVGRMGWHFGTDRWPAGAFFQYRITGLQPA